EQVDAVEERDELHAERLRERAEEDPAVGRRVEAVARIDAARIAADEERALVLGPGDVGAAVQGERRLQPARVKTLAGKSAQASEMRGGDAERREHARHVRDDRRR